MTWKDIGKAGSEPALSAAEPVAWLVKRYDLEGILLDTELSFVRPTIKSTCRADMVPLYTSPPAPSVAVKAGREAVTEIRRLHKLLGAHYHGKNGEPNLSIAKALEAALSAQVQDVSGLDADDVIDKLAAMPCETQGPEDLEAGCCRTCRARTIRAALEEPYDPVNFPPHPLDAAPAKQEGGNVTSQ
jgi:hypothetical protein